MTVPLSSVFPRPSAADSDDVVWTLQTAAVQWQRGLRADAIVWVRRAADTAVEGGQERRAEELRDSAARLAEFLWSDPDEVLSPNGLPAVSANAVPAELDDDDFLDDDEIEIEELDPYEVSASDAAPPRDHASTIADETETIIDEPEESTPVDAGEDVPDIVAESLAAESLTEARVLPDYLELDQDETDVHPTGGPFSSLPPSAASERPELGFASEPTERIDTALDEFDTMVPPREAGSEPPTESPTLVDAEPPASPPVWDARMPTMPSPPFGIPAVVPELDDAPDTPVEDDEEAEQTVQGFVDAAPGIDVLEGVIEDTVTVTAISLEPPEPSRDAPPLEPAEASGAEEEPLVDEEPVLAEPSEVEAEPLVDEEPGLAEPSEAEAEPLVDEEPVLAEATEVEAEPLVDEEPVLAEPSEAEAEPLEELAASRGASPSFLSAGSAALAARPSFSPAAAAHASPSLAPSAAAVSEAPPTVASPEVDGISLEAVDALGDLPEDAQVLLAALARVQVLGRGEALPLGEEGIALVTHGSVAVRPARAEIHAARVNQGGVVAARGSLAEGLPLRLVADADGTRVALWQSDKLVDVLSVYPWVVDELRLSADRVQARAGAALGVLGQRLDDGLRETVYQRMDVRVYAPGELVVAKGGASPGFLVVSWGELIAGDGEEATALGAGELVLATNVMTATPSPSDVRAGARGALTLFAPRMVAHELMMSVPPLLEIMAG